MSKLPVKAVESFEAVVNDRGAIDGFPYMSLRCLRVEYSAVIFTVGVDRSVV